MPRVKLTDEERAAKKKAQWAKLAAGTPNTTGMVGTPELWASIAETVVSRIGRLDFSKVQPHSTLLEIFGFTAVPTYKELVAARNKLLREDGIHPDHGGSDAMCRKVLEAYEQLKKIVLNS